MEPPWDGRTKVCSVVQVTWQRWLPCPYIVKTIKDIYNYALKKWGLYWICPVIVIPSFCNLSNENFSSHFSQELWGLEGWNLVHTWTMGGCIVYTGIRLLPLITPPANFVCGRGYCFHVVRPSIRPWHFGFFLISWKRSDGCSSISADTLISIRCTYIRKSKG